MTAGDAFHLEVRCDDLSERTLLFKELVILAFLAVVSVVRHLATGWLIALCFAPGAAVRAQEPQGAHATVLALMAEGQREEARGMLEELGVSGRSASAELGLILGVLRRDAGDLAAALSAFQEPLPRATGRERATLLAEIAVTHSWLGALEPAEEAYRASLVADPTFRPARVGLARILRWLGQRAEARALYRALLADGGDPVEAMIGMGLIAIEELDLRGARSWLHEALVLEPGNLEASAALTRLHEARRWQIRWSVGGIRGAETGPATPIAAAASYKVRPGSTVSASLDLAPHSADVVGSDPNAVAEGFVSSSAAVGWTQRLTRRWTGSMSAQRLTSSASSGHSGTVELGGWLTDRWAGQAGARAGSVPSIGAEAMGWAGLTRSWPSGRSLGAALFLGSDFRGATSRALRVSAAGLALGGRAPLSASVTRGWATSSGFWQATFHAAFEISSDREVTAEVSRFSGAYGLTAFRLGARWSF